MDAQSANALPVVLMVSPTGARQTKADHPALPMTADEIGRAAAESADAGANAVHVHVRDRDGRHTLEADAYRAAFAAIEREAGPNRVLIQATSEAFGIYQPAQQMAAMRALRPGAVSFALRELLPSSEHEAPAADFFAWLEREHIGAQCIVYNVDELQSFCRFRRRGIIPGDRVTLLLVLGRYTTGAVSKPADLMPYLRALDATQPHRWMTCAFGENEAACVLTAAALGGDMRVGFENNLQLADGRIAPSPAALVAQTAAGVPLMGRRLATLRETREALRCEGGRGGAAE
jgi:3-keto-5-aminohexanoate cleavage enzyme